MHLCAQAYLRMTGVQFTISPCSTNTRSPTGTSWAWGVQGRSHPDWGGRRPVAPGPHSVLAWNSCGVVAGQLPAVEAEGQFSSKAEGSEFAAARTCIDLARTTVKDLDAQLTTAQRAEVLAFASLLEQRLDTATEYSMWAEPSGYKAHVQVRAHFAGAWRCSAVGQHTGRKRASALGAVAGLRRQAAPLE